MLGVRRAAEEGSGFIMHLVLMDDTSGGAAGLVTTVIFLAIFVFYIAAMWRIFTKAGKPGWAVLIPIYSTFVLLSIVGRSAWWFILLLIPFVDAIVGIILLYDLAVSFGRGVGTFLGLLFLSPIFIPILAFGSAQYVGPRGAPVAVGAYR